MTDSADSVVTDKTTSRTTSSTPPSPEQAEMMTSAGSRLIAPKHIRDIAFSIIALAALIWLLKFAEAVIIPVLLGIIMSYSLRPYVEGLKQYAFLPRPMAAALILITIFSGVGIGLWTLREDATAVASELPKAARMIREFVGVARDGAPGLMGDIRTVARELDRATETLSITAPVERKNNVGNVGNVSNVSKGAVATETKPDQTISMVTRIQNTLLEQLGSLIAVISTVSVAGLLAFFLLCSGTDYRKKLLQIVGQSLSRKKITLTILNEINTQIQYYLAATAITNIGLGLATWALFAYFGIERAFLWGIVAALLHLIPYLGTALFLGLCFLIGLVALNSFWLAVYLSGAWLVVQFAIGFCLNTYIQSRSARINSAALFIGFLLFGWLWGGWGLIVAAPVLAALKAVSSRVESLKDVSTLMS
jgi:predicted PurR-regulated permease PerM